MKLDIIVVGTDGSPNATLAVDAAGDLAEGSGGTVHVVCAYEPTPPHELQDMLSQLPKEFHETFDPAVTQRNVVTEAVRRLERRGVACKPHLVPEHPVSAILDTADDVDADLIVVGARGAGWVRRAFRGSVSSRVASHATRNLLVIHEPDTEE